MSFVNTNVVVKFERTEGNELKGTTVSYPTDFPTRKIVFLLGYKPEKINRWIGDLPEDGSLWVCRVTTITKPALQMAGVVFVKLVSKKLSEVQRVQRDNGLANFHYTEKRSILDKFVLLTGNKSISWRDLSAGQLVLRNTAVTLWDSIKNKDTSPYLREPRVWTAEQFALLKRIGVWTPREETDAMCLLQKKPVAFRRFDHAVSSHPNANPGSTEKTWHFDAWTAIEALQVMDTQNLAPIGVGYVTDWIKYWCHKASSYIYANCGEDTTVSMANDYWYYLSGDADKQMLPVNEQGHIIGFYSLYRYYAARSSAEAWNWYPDPKVVQKVISQAVLRLLEGWKSEMETFPDDLQEELDAHRASLETPTHGVTALKAVFERFGYSSLLERFLHEAPEMETFLEKLGPWTDNEFSETEIQQFSNAVESVFGGALLSGDGFFFLRCIVFFRLQGVVNDPKYGGFWNNAFWYQLGLVQQIALVLNWSRDEMRSNWTGAVKDQAKALGMADPRLVFLPLR